jgi:inhibitor of KinA
MFGHDRDTGDIRSGSPVRKDAGVSADIPEQSEGYERGGPWRSRPNEVPSASTVKGHSFRIPVCYDGDYGPDLEWTARQKGLSVEDVIRIHHSGSYRIYMVGFLPGFPYLGKLDSRLEIPRKDRPVSVMRGGVGIAGIQTGIYPLSSPGGWQIIGRTPVRLFDWLTDPPIRFQCGDEVEFYPISREEFLQWKNP